MGMSFQVGGWAMGFCTENGMGQHWWGVSLLDRGGVGGRGDGVCLALNSCLAPTPHNNIPSPIPMQIPMHSASGVRVQYLKVWEKSSYKVDKWVRKLCKSGDYHTRF